ncbi:hypothetical protein Nekkels1_12 [Cellulophaga phage Nekkels_1]|uniref:Uncharacterized protein n=1 Tax=Cellulophaga phage Nekkels_1 TaxID=2745692 RepID=A0A8E4UXE5_9CAUD|nr:hypothetical protein M1M31_gp12 [Cellulophaga phage Nekkels_1]QQO97011.1 hypothetical protein Nekkels1_12 [Cellulophaga phage Nekkels_1]QQO97104.1 hypothetical protein Nekkels2_12 [Cellulophaga phage Nekkels_2]
MENSINKYIDFNSLFLELYNEQEDILIEERIQADHFDRILKFKEQSYSEFEIMIEECSYDTKEIVFVFAYDFDDSNEDCSQSTTADYVIVYDTILDEFTSCDYEQG